MNHVPRVTSDDRSFDYIVITTKNVPGVGQDMAEVIAPAVSPGITVIVLLQNGLNIERSYSERYPENIILSGVSFAGSQEVTPGTIEHGSHDHLLLGAFRNPNVDVASGEAAARSFVSLYAASGKASCFYTAEAMSHRWRKLVYNATINPLCAITNLDSGSLRQSGPAITKLIEDAMGEILAVSAASGYMLPPGTAQELLSLDAVDEHFEPSMLQDVRKVCKSSVYLSMPRASWFLTVPGEFHRVRVPRGGTNARGAPSWCPDANNLNSLRVVPSCAKQNEAAK